MTSHPDITRMFEDALGIAEPWRVEGVAFDDSEKRFDIFLGFERGSTFSCGSCGHEGCKAYDTAPRRWRHLDGFQRKCYFHAPSPRVQCPNCRVRKAAIPWARPKSRFTLLFEAFIVQAAKEMPVNAVARMVDEHDTVLWRIVAHYVDKALAKADHSQAVAVGVDEKAAKRGHDYITLFADLDERKLLFATRNRTSDVFREFRKHLEAHKGSAGQIDEICMDMSKAYMRGAKDEFPDAQVTFDRFHIVKLLNEAIEAVRRTEQKRRPDLKNTRWLWLKNRDRLTAAQKKQLDKMLDETADNILDTAKAYKMKAAFKELWELPPLAAEAYLERWCDTALLCGLEPLERFARTVLDHWKGILGWFRSRISNSLLEAMNSLVQAAKARARGYRTTDNLVTMAYLVCGHLEFDLPT